MKVIQKIKENIYRYEDSCHVYVLKNGKTAVLIDFGTGAVLDALPEIGVEKITDILVTHHHRDQIQGLPIAEQKGISIWIPHVEQDLIASADSHWQSREVDNNYNVRQDRFTILNSVKGVHILQDYSTMQLGEFAVQVLPTPGHTTGSVSFIVDRKGEKFAFTGDLIAGPGKAWSLAATQWSYNGGEGIPYSILSLLDLRERNLTALYPSHGTVMNSPAEAIDQLVEKYSELMQWRKQNPRLFQLREQPFKRITPHLLFNRTSMANSYVLLSESKKALIIDYGYDFTAGIGMGSDRAARRPWLYNMERLKKAYDIEQIEAVMPTHYHDDHVAGINLLREIEGAQVWSPENFADVLEDPKKYNLPCLWYDSIPVTRVLPLEKPIQWEEYTFTLFEMPGHTLYAAAIMFEADGKRILAIGDQYQEEQGEPLSNYVYENQFRPWDYKASAQLIKEYQPDLLLSGHWEPVEVTENYIEKIGKLGDKLEKLHQDILPAGRRELGVSTDMATLYPYQIVADREMGSFPVEIELYNPKEEAEDITFSLILPSEWNHVPVEETIKLEAKQTYQKKVTIPCHGLAPQRRARIAVDVKAGNQLCGQVAEALVTIK